MKYVVGTLLFVVRCIPVLVLVVLLLAAEFLSYLVFLERIFS